MPSIDHGRRVMAGGVGDLRAALDRWRAERWRVVAAWALRSGCVAVALLVATVLVAAVATPDASSFDLAGVTRPAEAADVQAVVMRNLLVLALHALACVAAYLARRSVVLEASGYGPFWQRLHTRIGALALAFVAGATIFSFATQAVGLGMIAATLANGLQIAPATLIAGLSAHALPELVAVFLPLAAWWREGRHGRWNDLMAATFVTVAVALPVIVACGFVEVYLSPHLLDALVG